MHDPRATVTDEDFERVMDRAVAELMEEGLTESQACLSVMQEMWFDEAPVFGVLGARVGQPLIGTDLELEFRNEESSSLVVGNLTSTLPSLLDSPGAALRATPRRPGAPA